MTSEKAANGNMAANDNGNNNIGNGNSNMKAKQRHGLLIT
jgi:hypothetical protein